MTTRVTDIKNTVNLNNTTGANHHEYRELMLTHLAHSTHTQSKFDTKFVFMFLFKKNINQNHFESEIIIKIVS